jgi:hypothetical protein
VATDHRRWGEGDGEMFMKHQFVAASAWRVTAAWCAEVRVFVHWSAAVPPKTRDDGDGC